jgi:hypothetical protein
LKDGMIYALPPHPTLSVGLLELAGEQSSSGT